MITDWLMVIITFVYVIATIFICIYNAKSVKAAKEQIEVTKNQIRTMVEQYNSVNRTLVSIHFDIIRSGLLCFIIENNGPLAAENVQVKINKEFIENIKNSNEKMFLEKLNEAVFYLASRQKETVLLGGVMDFDNISQQVAKVNISYNTYTEYTEIDINQYRFSLIYSSPLEDISQNLKKIKENNETFHKNIIKSMDRPAKIQNVVIHNENEDEACKFKLYKTVCLNAHSTVEQLAEKLELDKEYTLGLLFELYKVDRLIAYTFNEETKDNDKALWYKRQ